jgi:hypothetical protein
MRFIAQRDATVTLGAERDATVTFTALGGLR